MNNYDPNEEHAAAQGRIDDIIATGQDAGTRQASSVPESARAAPARVVLPQSPPASRRMGRRAGIVIGGLVLAGLLLVGVLMLLASMLGGGGSPLLAPLVPTATATLTLTPTVTATPTASPTPTPEMPFIPLPPLACLTDERISCYDYCNGADNAEECDESRALLQQYGVDFDYWLRCVAPGPGPNIGDPLDCLEDAWRVSVGMPPLAGSGSTTTGATTTPAAP